MLNENDDVMNFYPKFSMKEEDKPKPKEEVKVVVNPITNKADIKLRTDEELALDSIKMRRWTWMYLLCGCMFYAVEFFVNFNLYLVGNACFVLSILYFIDMESSIIRYELRKRT